MSDDLQALIDKIRSEGVDKAQSEAERIVAEARERAAQMVREAEKSAAAAAKKADKEADLAAERGTRTLEQAARDVILQVGQGVEKLLGQLVRAKVEATLDPALLKELIRKLVDGYLAGMKDGSATIHLAEEDAKALGDFFQGELKSALAEGVSIQADRAGARGFKVSLAGGQVSHDFSAAAIADALSDLVRPRLAEILRTAATEASA